MLKKIILGLLFIVIALTAMTWWNSQQTDQTHTQISSISTQTPKKQSTQQHSVSQESQKMISSAQTEKKREKMDSTHQEAFLFESLPIEEAKLTTTPRNNIEPIMAISISNHTLASLNKEDILTLTDIEGYDYPLTIRSVTTYDDGTINTTGVYSDEGIDYTTTITQAKGTSYITLSTPRGIYEIETKNDVGYIYSANEIRKRLQRGRKDDTVPYQPQPHKGE